MDKLPDPVSVVSTIREQLNPLGLGRAILIPIVADFLKAYPEIKVRMIPTDRVLSLFQEHVDVGLRIGTLPDSSLIAIPLGTTRRVLCASPAYLATHGTPRTPEDLVGHDCINYIGSASGDIWTFVRDKAVVAVPVHTRLDVGLRGALVMHLEVRVGAVAEKFRTARPEIGEAGDVLFGRRSGCPMEIEGRHASLAISFILTNDPKFS
jgi:DNA-binding transcriptional LysR family regulator